MSTGPTNLNEVEVLSQRVTGLNGEARKLVDALAQVKRTRLILMLALVLFAGGTCYSFYNLFAQFREKEQTDLLLNLAQARLTERNDFIMNHVQGLVDHSAPVLSNAFYEQSKKDLPAFLQATQSERDKLVQNLEIKLTEKLKVHHEKLLARHEKLLKEEFPSVKDEQLHAAMMANLQVAVDDLVKKYYIKEFESEMNSLYAMWDDFPAASTPDKDDAPLADQLIGNLLELVKIKMAESDKAVASLTSPGVDLPTGATPIVAPPAGTPPAATPPAVAAPTEKAAASAEKVEEKPAEKPAEKVEEKPAEKPAADAPAAAAPAAPTP